MKKYKEYINMKNFHGTLFLQNQTVTVCINSVAVITNIVELLRRRSQSH